MSEVRAIPTKATGPLPGLPGRIAARLYGTMISRRNRAFDAGRGVVRIDRPVISVGNLSVGGTGKTPMVVHLVRSLLAAGHLPCIAMRGYRSGVEAGSDEAGVYGREFPGVSVVAQPNRVEGLMELFASAAGACVDCVVLDDGFQHRQLARDLDCVLIDATRPPWEDNLLPQGWLREPVESLGRAHAVVVTHAEAVGPSERRRLLSLAKGVAPRAVAAACRHEWEDLRDAQGGVRGLETLRGLRVVACCAIGNPGPFLSRAAAAVGGPLVGELVLRDHDPYASSTIVRLLELLRRTGAEALLTTEKDWSKLGRVEGRHWPCVVLRPVLSLVFDEGGADLEEAVLRCVRSSGQYE